MVLMVATLAMAQPPQQDKSKRPSPHDSTEVTLKGKKITIEYGRPYLKGRKVGRNCACGKYTLYTLPSEGTWKLIINKETGQWGTKYDESQDLARIDMKKSPLPQSVEQFTISFNKTSHTTAELKSGVGEHAGLSDGKDGISERAEEWADGYRSQLLPPPPTDLVPRLRVDPGTKKCISPL